MDEEEKIVYSKAKDLKEAEKALRKEQKLFKKKEEQK